MKMTIAIISNTAYSTYVAQTTATGFGSPERHRRTHRPKTLAVFLRLHYALVRPLWAGYGGEGVSPAGSFVASLPTLPYARPPHLEVGSGLNYPTKEAITWLILLFPLVLSKHIPHSL